MKYITTIGDREFEVEVPTDPEENQILINGVAHVIDFQSVSGGPVYSLLVDGRSFEVHVYPTDEGWQVLMQGELYPALVEDEREQRLRAALGPKTSDGGEFQLRAPMPGLVVSVPVSEGQKIEKGDVLAILESMKMQNELKSPRAGTVTRLRIKPGDSVEQKQVMLTVV